MITVAEIDAEHLRTVMSHFATGVVVITGIDEVGEPAGMTAQSFVSLSLDPPLVMVSPARDSKSWGRIAAGGRFAINVLGGHQHELSSRFAQHRDDKFSGVRWLPGQLGLPLLDGAIAHIECEIADVFPGGDHYIAVGHVRTLNSVVDDPEPLLFFRAGYRSLDRKGR
ncbi:flavin reductase family protein [Microbacterium horticulturae]|uniref:Flavin reductase family protein n=1 Tax=Microbacterium horticulturae TaxID=3028316 RepID=A0ABY8BW78_9MICO|nr:flavin reductase family protein [Microbacterium sp. KACC 23027]WEG08414.1 flavin reductase family protein [Microbacterium sp. KACC 23027]